MLLVMDEACFTREGFSTAMFGQKQTLISHLFTATNNSLQSMFWQALCMTFWLGLVTLMAHCTDSLSFSGWQATRNAGGNPVGTQEKHAVPAQQGCSSFCMSGPRTSHCHLQQLLERKERACGLASQVTRHHIHFFLWGHIKALIYTSPADSKEDLIARIVEVAATWHCWGHTSISAAALLAVYRGQWLCAWTSALNWYKM